MGRGASEAYEIVDQKVTETLREVRDILETFRSSEQVPHNESEKDESEIHLDSNDISPISPVVTSYDDSSVASKIKQEAAPQKKKKVDSQTSAPTTDSSSMVSSLSTKPKITPSSSSSAESHGNEKKCNCKKNEISFPEAKLSPYRDELEYLKIHRTSLQTLDDIEHLKSTTFNGPDDLFPHASYRGPSKIIKGFNDTESRIEQNGSRTSSPSHSSTFVDELPKVFYSSDGRMAMFLQRIDSNGQITAFAIKDQERKKVKALENMFPSIPKQLDSAPKLTNQSRRRFCGSTNIGHQKIEISGIFKNDKLDMKNLEKIVINGKCFKIN